MNRFWVSWYSGYYDDEGCSAPPFQVWITGYRDRENHGLSMDQLEELEKIKDEEEYYNYIDAHAKTDCTICALIDAENEDEIWKAVKMYFPDYRYRFCEVREPDWTPNDRFQNFENRTTL